MSWTLLKTVDHIKTKLSKNHQLLIMADCNAFVQKFCYNTESINNFTNIKASNKEKSNQKLKVERRYIFSYLVRSCGRTS